MNLLTLIVEKYDSVIGTMLPSIKYVVTEK